MLAHIKEQEGKIEEAATLLQEVQVQFVHFNITQPHRYARVVVLNRNFG